MFSIAWHFVNSGGSRIHPAAERYLVCGRGARPEQESYPEYFDSTLAEEPPQQRSTTRVHWEKWVGRLGVFACDGWGQSQQTTAYSSRCLEVKHSPLTWWKVVEFWEATYCKPFLPRSFLLILATVAWVPRMIMTCWVAAWECDSLPRSSTMSTGSKQCFQTTSGMLQKFAQLGEALRD